MVRVVINHQKRKQDWSEETSASKKQIYSTQHTHTSKTRLPAVIPRTTCPKRTDTCAIDLRMKNNTERQMSRRVQKGAVTITSLPHHQQTTVLKISNLQSLLVLRKNRKPKWWPKKNRKNNQMVKWLRRHKQTCPCRRMLINRHYKWWRQKKIDFSISSFSLHTCCTFSLHMLRYCLAAKKKKTLQLRYSWDWSAVRSCDIMRHRLQSATWARHAQIPRVA